MRIGLVLSGGGARGVAHVGVIKALEEFGLTFNCIAGTSAGSIVASLYAHGYRPTQILEIIQQVTVFKSVRPAWRWAGLLNMDGMKALLLKHMPENDFNALKIPLTVAVTEMRLGEIRYFTKGELVPVVMASCSIPAIFNPMEIQGGLYVDGGVLDNLPSGPLKNQCDFLIGSHCNQIPKEFDPTSLKVVIERTMLMAINANTLFSKGLCDVLIEPPGLGKYGAFDIGRAQEIFDFAYRYTKDNFTAKDFEKIKA